MKQQGQVENLPKWAQQKIRVLQMRLDEARERIQGETVEGSVVFANPYDDYPKPLGDADVEFRLNGTKIKVSIRHHVGNIGAVLDVNCSGGRVWVQPRASNSFEVHTELG